MNANTDKLNIEKAKKPKYVSELIGEEYKSWDKETIILDCETGTGKTYFCIRILGTFAQSCNLKILYLCNRTKLKQNIVDEVWFGDLTDTIDVMSYQKLQNELMLNVELPHYDYIIADECHYFFSDSDFNDCTDVSFRYLMRQRKNSVILLVSATAKGWFSRLIANGQVVKNHRYTLGKDYTYVKHVYFYQENDLISAIDGILEEEQESKILVFCQNLDRLLDLHSIYGEKAQYYCSKNTTNRKAKRICGWNDGSAEQCIQNGTFQKRILFTTTVLDNGVDLKDKSIKHIFTEILDVDTMIQTLGRKRRIDDEDTCTFYIREYPKQGFAYRIMTHKNKLKPVELYEQDYEEFLVEYGKNREELQKNNLFYIEPGEDKGSGILRINVCKYRKMKSEIRTFGLMKKLGHREYLINMMPTHLANVSESIVLNAKQIDHFLEVLKSYEGKRIYKSDQKKIVEEFKNSIVMKLDARTVGIHTINGQLRDVYGDSYPLRFYNENSNGKSYYDRRRVLEDGSSNPNRDKRYWMLEEDRGWI